MGGGVGGLLWVGGSFVILFMRKRTTYISHISALSPSPSPQIISPNHQFCKEDGILRFADLPHLWKGLVEPEDYSFFLELLSFYGIAYTVPYNTSFLSSAATTPPSVTAAPLPEKAELTRPVSFSNLPSELNPDNIRIFVPCRMTTAKDERGTQSHLEQRRHAR